MPSEIRVTLTAALRRKAQELGFELFGVAAVDAHPELARYLQWLEAGYHGEMAYLARNEHLRRDPGALVENAQSVIACGKIYHTAAPLSVEPAPEGSGWIARYAWGDDYHDILKRKIRELYLYLQEISDGRALGRYYVDTGPVLEKVWGKYAGLGWIGKNTCLINQQRGSFFFLAVIVSNVVLDYATPPPDRCGTCRKCIEACPTNAILAPYVLDANRCISYLTIEFRGAVPEPLRQQMGRHIFGCDICQDVCPWNRKASVTQEQAFQPRPGNVNPALRELLQIDIEQYRERFRRSPVKRAKWRGLKRNTFIAAGNSGLRALAPLLRPYLRDDDALLREHAEWAYQRLNAAGHECEGDA